MSVPWSSEATVLTVPSPPPATIMRGFSRSALLVIERNSSPERAGRMRAARPLFWKSSRKAAVSLWPLPEPAAAFTTTARASSSKAGIIAQSVRL